jgi:hypothetical protein
LQIAAVFAFAFNIRHLVHQAVLFSFSDDFERFFAGYLARVGPVRI